MRFLKNSAISRSSAEGTTISISPEGVLQVTTTQCGITTAPKALPPFLTLGSRWSAGRVSIAEIVASKARGLRLRLQDGVHVASLPDNVSLPCFSLLGYGSHGPRRKQLTIRPPPCPMASISEPPANSDPDPRIRPGWRSTSRRPYVPAALRDRSLAISASWHRHQHCGGVSSQAAFSPGLKPPVALGADVCGSVLRHTLTYTTRPCADPHQSQRWVARNLGDQRSVDLGLELWVVNPQLGHGVAHAEHEGSLSFIGTSSSRRIAAWRTASGQVPWDGCRLVRPRRDSATRCFPSLR